MRRISKILLFLILLILFDILILPHSNINAAEVTDYLILNDIGDYQFITQTKDFFTREPKTIPGYTAKTSSGKLVGTGHFDLDHDDITYETDYLNRSAKLVVDVQVTKHAGGDSDKWLLHELERDFRNYYGLPGDSYVIRLMNGNIILASGAGGWIYRWLSNDKIVNIEYTDLQMTKPEPLEVISAYLAKHPSTLPSMTSADLRTDENKTKWIKDEMERRLWLCDKWFQQLDEGKIEKYKVLSEVVNDHLEVFLNYRQKYYEINAEPDKKTLFAYLQAENDKEIRKKLTEYKQWWTENKTKPINLP
jgi:hypothetical protein